MNSDFINKIIEGDCLEKMAELEPASVDMILSDLPYGVTSNNKWDKTLPCDQLWNLYKRVIKPNGAIILTATQPFASQLICSNPKMFKYDLIWEKNKCTGFLNANKMPLRNHESILVFYKKRPVYHPQKTTGHKPVNSYTKYSDGTTYGKTKTGVKGGGQTDRHPQSVLKFSVVNNDSDQKIHSSQKPVSLFEFLIKSYTNENDVVLDNCLGSGTTCIAAINTGRRYIGIEKDAESCLSAKNRVENHLIGSR